MHGWCTPWRATGPAHHQRSRSHQVLLHTWANVEHGCRCWMTIRKHGHVCALHCTARPWSVACPRMHALLEEAVHGLLLLHASICVVCLSFACLHRHRHPPPPPPPPRRLWHAANAHLECLATPGTLTMHACFSTGSSATRGATRTCAAWQLNTDACMHTDDVPCTHGMHACMHSWPLGRAWIAWAARWWPPAPSCTRLLQHTPLRQAAVSAPCTQAGAAGREAVRASPGPQYPPPMYMRVRGTPPAAARALSAAAHWLLPSPPVHPPCPAIRPSLSSTRSPTRAGGRPAASRWRPPATACTSTMPLGAWATCARWAIRGH